jgi:hypothetical protein
MTTHTTSATASKSSLETINLETVSSDLAMALTFIEAAAHFAENLYKIAHASNATIADCFKPDAEHAGNMISEIGCRVGNAKEHLDAFIDAVPASQLSVERKEA